MHNVTQNKREGSPQSLHQSSEKGHRAQEQHVLPTETVRDAGTGTSQSRAPPPQPSQPGAGAKNRRNMASLGLGKLPEECLSFGRPSAPHLAGQHDQPGSAVGTRELRVRSLFPTAGLHQCVFHGTPSVWRPVPTSAGCVLLRPIPQRPISTWASSTWARLGQVRLRPNFCFFQISDFGHSGVVLLLWLLWLLLCCCVLCVVVVCS